jgi:IS5 family transposase
MNSDLLSITVLSQKAGPALIEAVTPWTLLVAELEPHYTKGEGRGRPPIGHEKMLRMYIAQQCFGFPR